MLIFLVMLLLFGLNLGYFTVTKRSKVDIDQKCLFDRRLPSESEGSEIKQLKFPVKTKDVISRLTQSTQIALEKKLSRIEIQLPPLFDLGLTERNPALKENEISRTNRELAKLFLEMFAVLKDSSAVIFPTLEEAKRAEDQWSKKNFFEKKNIFHFSEKRDWKSLSKTERKRLEEMKMTEIDFNLDEYLLVKPVIPPTTELLLIISPQPKDYPLILSFHQDFGPGTLILLINSRFVWNDLLERRSFVGSMNEDPLSFNVSHQDKENEISRKREQRRNKKPSSSPLSSETSFTSTSSSSSALSKDYLLMKKIVQAFPNSFYYSPPVLSNAQQLMKEISKSRTILLFHEKIESNWYLVERVFASDRAKEKNPFNALTAMMTNLVDQLDESRSLCILLSKSSGKPTEEEIIAALKNSE